MTRSAGAARGPEPPISYTTQGALRAVEVLAFTPASAPAVARVLGVHARTARRTLKTLAGEGYVARSSGPRAEYRPTVRLLALAAQLGERLPLVVHGREVVATLAKHTASGPRSRFPATSTCWSSRAPGPAPTPGTLLPARKSALGHALLAQRPAWRESLGWSTPPIPADLELGTALTVPHAPPPIAAVGLTRGPRKSRHAADALAAACRDLAARLAR